MDAHAPVPPVPTPAAPTAVPVVVTPAQPVTTLHVVCYLVIAVVVAMATAFEAALVKGDVPLPAAWAWIVPIVAAGITALTMLLPRVVDSPWPG